MRFSSYINNQRCLEWGLNANQGALFDLLNQASSWAKEFILDGKVYYWVSRNEIIKELPLFYAKADTVYRHFVALSEKALIEYRKYGGKDLVRLTPKGKMWNEFSSEINPNGPTELGNKSEQTRIEIRKSSEINPTNNNTNYKNTIDHNHIDRSPPAEPKKPDAFELHFNEFWNAGLVKLAKDRAKASFKRAYQRANAENPISLADFTDTLINDIRQRLRLGQFGFDRLHPATYLNQARWQDELPSQQAVQSGQMFAKPANPCDYSGDWAKGRFIHVREDLLK